MEQRTGSPTTKLVLLKLADNANEWVAWPSVQYIVDDTELSERAVREHLRKLETLGLVRAEKRFVDGVQTTTKYHLLADGWVPRKAGERIPRKKDKGASGAPVGHDAQELHNMQGDGAESAPPVGHDAPPNPYGEPLSEPTLSASENSPSVKPKEEPSAAWSEFWTACTSWPGASDDWPESVAKAEWLALGADRPTDSEMILCARAHGVWLAEENRRRPRSAGDRIPASPHRWLKERRYSKYLEKAKANALAALDNLAKNPVTLDQPIIARILRAGISQGQIDNYFAGATYEIGPPQTFRQSIACRASWIANNFGERLRGVFLDDPATTEKPKKVSAA